MSIFSDGYYGDGFLFLLILIFLVCHKFILYAIMDKHITGIGI